MLYLNFRVETSQLQFRQFKYVLYKYNPNTDLYIVVSYCNLLKLNQPIRMNMCQMTYGTQANFLIQTYVRLWLITIHPSDTTNIILYLFTFLISTLRLIFISQLRKCCHVHIWQIYHLQLISYLLLHVLNRTHTASKMS
jgi:hypothetical protein